MRIVPIPRDTAVRDLVARWSIDEWGRDFPGDTAETYLGLYELADADPDRLPVVLVALDDLGDPVGTATLIDDDELPGALEPGPWLAAVYVRPDARGDGIGASLVAAVEAEAARLGAEELFLYTPDGTKWYAAMGWTEVRDSRLHARPVTVMHKSLVGHTRVAQLPGHDARGGGNS